MIYLNGITDEHEVYTYHYLSENILFSINGREHFRVSTVWYSEVPVWVQDHYG